MLLLHLLEECVFLMPPGHFSCLEPDPSYAKVVDFIFIQAAYMVEKVTASYSCV